MIGCTAFRRTSVPLAVYLTCFDRALCFQMPDICCSLFFCGADVMLTRFPNTLQLQGPFSRGPLFQSHATARQANAGSWELELNKGHHSFGPNQHEKRNNLRSGWTVRPRRRPRRWHGDQCCWMQLGIVKNVNTPYIKCINTQKCKIDGIFPLFVPHWVRFNIAEPQWIQTIKSIKIQNTNPFKFFSIQM